ncbi:MAG: hypothetical protein EXS64_10715 [Candidatus Latescibacteria bacterium]|nr:hypothetical protein [Candidatus Latescibacterota bacterium]
MNTPIFRLPSQGYRNPVLQFLKRFNDLLRDPLHPGAFRRLRGITGYNVKDEVVAETEIVIGRRGIYRVRGENIKGRSRLGLDRHGRRAKVLFRSDREKPRYISHGIGPGFEVTLYRQIEQAVRPQFHASKFEPKRPGLQVYDGICGILIDQLQFQAKQPVLPLQDLPLLSQCEK